MKLSNSDTVAAVGIIKDLIQSPLTFEGQPLTREEIYDRSFLRSVIARLN